MNETTISQYADRIVQIYYVVTVISYWLAVPTDNFMTPGATVQTDAESEEVETLCTVLLLRHHDVTRILANGSAAFFESCTTIGWKDFDSVRLL